MTCPLCRGETRLFFERPGKKYFRCDRCLAVFLDPACRLSQQEEKQRYEKHHNDVDDPGYRSFVAPIVSVITEKFSNRSLGLDFGAGPGPVVAKLLREQGYVLELYDPYFCDTPEVLEKKYDFIVCCEVIEHFNSPAKEFQLLRSLLRPGGALFCMTELYSEKIDFLNWHYKNDPTHVIFYHQQTLRAIKTLFDFSSVENNGRVVQFAVK